MLAMRCRQRKRGLGDSLMIDALRPQRQEPAHAFHLKRPVQFASPGVIAQDRHALPVAFLKHLIIIDEHACELRRTRSRQHLKRKVAQVAFIALIKNKTHTPASLHER